MRVLITGASGFVGQHLAAHLRRVQPRAVVHGTALSPRETVSPALDKSWSVDLKDEARARRLLADCRPDAIYHLAAQAFVPRSFENPWETLENNIRSQLNIIQACLTLGIRPRILIVGSAEVYGAVEPHQLPMTEDMAMKPNSPYSVSKAAQDMLGLQFYLSHQLPIMRARPFNHIGPGQNIRFVAPAFAMQIAKIEENRQKPFISIGNLQARRDFTDVRDIARAYHLIIEKGRPGQAYNVASGRAHSIRYLLDVLLGLSDIEIEARVDPARLRPVDVPEIRGDASKLRRDTGWRPTRTFEDALKDVLSDCRQRISGG